MTDVLLVAGGGMIGGSTRMMWSTLAGSSASAGVTLAENLIGTLLLAVALTCLADRAGIRRRIRLAVGTGVLGSFTTTSAMAVEAAALTAAGDLVIAVGYLAASAFGGLACAWAGVRLGRVVCPAQTTGALGAGKVSP